MSPRTRIACGWLVGHADRPSHAVAQCRPRLRRRHRGHCSSASASTGASTARSTHCDKLVAPGFIDTHVHSGHRASHRLISDIGRGDYFGQPFLEIQRSPQGSIRGWAAIRDLRPPRRQCGGRGTAPQCAPSTVAGAALARRHHHIRRVWEPAARPAGAARRRWRARHPGLPRSGLRQRPLGRRRGRQACPGGRRGRGRARIRAGARLHRAPPGRPCGSRAWHSGAARDRDLHRRPDAQRPPRNRAGARPAGRDPRRLQYPRGVRHHSRTSDDVG